ncbi:ABC transporter ATP-binding protein [Paenibacillus sp. PK4536]|uniref:ABC transporter ATP-binding protein n=1 Tax=Paenibacillus sp. PK4536 TaxID=3024576 RepID=UPI002358FC6A|nr:ABC transporter ATP-binding protein [Paenibacillus sp. PK4536]WIM39914.1 ABC transporter ATP-binding protein [Paenibacillus sp. PK4536]
MGNPMMPGRAGRSNSTPVKAKNAKSTVRRLWDYLRQQRKGLILVFILTLLGTAFNLITPYLLGTIAFDRYILPGNYAGLAILCIWLLILYVVASLTSWIQAYVMTAVSQQTVFQIRRDLFKHLHDLPLRFFDTHSSGDLMSRSTNDIENVTTTLNQSVVQIMTSALTLVGTLIIMVWLNIWLTLVTLITVPIMFWLTRIITKRTRRYFGAQQTELGGLNGYIEETISGQKVVKAYVQEARSLTEFKEINHRLLHASIRAQSWSGNMGPVMNLVNNISYALIALSGGWLFLQGMTSVGVIVSFLSYSKQFSRPINELANQFNLLQSAIAGAERVFEVLDERPESTEDEKTAVHQLPANVHGEVIFDHVQFSYKAGSPILRDVSLTAKPGQTIALVGPTGAGKTTIINLLTRFYEIDSGTITIDGEDIRLLDKENLRSRIGIVLQDAYLFSGTVRDNIRYGRLEATDQEIEEAAKLANAHSFIHKLPEGYDSPLSADGSNLSQGQRQLLTIARAILANPSVLILDEATSSVDTRTEMHIQTAMKQLMHGRTSFVIAHRLSTIREADQILVIQSGEVVERGTHDELLQAGGFYHDLYQSQFNRVV